MATSPLRHVVIGVGAGIFTLHQQALALETADLVAVCDINPELGRPRAETLSVPFYEDHRQMLADTKPDVAVIITPHPYHAPLAIDSLQAGSHVLVEKPLAVEVAEADRMIEAAEDAKRLLAVNFQQRYRPESQAAHRLIQDGELGEIQHVAMTVTWPRTRSYYRAAGWRGTWRGEGGGLLMNQAPHDLDLLCYLLGLPERVVAWTATTLHEIETEDTAQAMLRWPNGAMGTVHASTAESGIPQRLEILGTGGVLRLERGQLSVERFETDLRDHVRDSDSFYRGPALKPRQIELPEGAGNHQSVYQNLHTAIQDGAPLIADGESCRMGLELSNAMIFSSHRQQEVSLPLDRAAYSTLLAELRGTG